MYPLLAEVGSPAILVVLADAAMKGTLLLMLAALLVLAMRKASAAARHLVWTGALTAALVLPLMSFLLPAWHVPWLPNLGPIRQSLPSANLETEIPSTRLTTPNLTNETASVGQNAQNSLPTTGNPASVANDTPAPAPIAHSQPLKNFSHESSSTSAPSSPSLSRSSAILSIWVIGAVLALSPLVIGWVLISKATRCSAVETSLQWQQSLLAAMSDLNLRRKVRLRRGASVKMPLTWGAWAPVLLLPEASDKWAESRRRAVLLHELAHIKRWDWLTQTLASVACALYWFNPFVWIAARQMRDEREQACDDLVLRRGLLPSDYAEELVQLAADGEGRGLLNCVAVPIARRPTLERRVRAILDGRRNRATLTRTAVLSALTLVAVVAVPIAMLRAAVPSASTSAAKPAINTQGVLTTNPLSGGNSGADAGGATQSSMIQPDRYARMVAVSKITDQTALAKLMEDPKEDRGVRFQATACLTDAKLLTDAIARMKAAPGGFSDDFQVVASLRLALLDPIIRSRLGDLELIPTYVDHETGGDGGYISETITLEIRQMNQSSQSLAYGKWVTEDVLRPEADVLIPADINCDALLVELLKNLNAYDEYSIIAHEAVVPELRKAAVTAMIWLNDGSLADIVLGDPDADVRRAAVEKIAEVQGHDDGFNAQRLLAQVAQQDKDEQVRYYAVKHLTIQPVLEQIAQNDKNDAVRGVAVENLTDEAVLEKLALDETNESAAGAAVEKLTNQAVLAQIALSARNENIRRAALQKLTDQAVLAQVVRQEKDSVLGLTALQNLQDQALLAQLASGSKNPYVRALAANNLTDQALLLKMAQTETNWEILKAVENHLTDQPTLATLAESRDPNVSEGAFKNLTDQNLLAKIALAFSPYYHESGDVRLLALDKITDQTQLAKIALNATSYLNNDVREAATRELTDPAALLQIALLPGDDFTVPLAATEKLTKQDDLAKVAKEGQTEFLREFAASRRQFLAAPPPDTTQSLDQEAFAAIALNSADSSSRSYAIEELTDQAILAKVALGDQDADIRHGAVSRLAEPAALAKVAEADPDPELREFAAQQISDQAVLVQIAQTDPAPKVRGAVVGKINDQTVLAKIAQTDANPTVRLYAFDHLTNADQTLIAKLVNEEQDGKARAAAVSHLTDQTLLAKLAQEDPDARVRATAVGQIAGSNQALLAKIVQADSAPQVREAAARGLTDPALLRQLALAAPDAAVRTISVSQMTDQTILASVIQHDQDDQVREAALWKVRDHALLEKVALEDQNPRMRLKAVDTMEDLDGTSPEDQGEEAGRVISASPAEIAQDTAVLGKIVLADKDYRVRDDAMLAVSDQAVLTQVARFDPDAPVRSYAITRLTDASILAQIAQQDNDPQNRKAASQKLAELSAN